MNPGVIAGPVVAVLVIASLVLFWYLRRKKVSTACLCLDQSQNGEDQADRNSSAVILLDWKNSLLVHAKRRSRASTCRNLVLLFPDPHVPPSLLALTRLDTLLNRSDHSSRRRR